MTVLSRTELEASPLADLHTIASEIGMDGYRLKKRDDLIDSILDRGEGSSGRSSSRRSRSRRSSGSNGDGERRPRRERSDRNDRERDDRGGRSERSSRSSDRDGRNGDRDRDGGRSERSSRSDRGGRSGDRDRDDRGSRSERGGRDRDRDRSRSSRDRSGRGSERDERSGGREQEDRRSVTGSLKLRPQGSGLITVEGSDEEIYVSASQIRRFELEGGEQITGPVRPQRRSEKWPTLARIESIDGEDASGRGGKPGSSGERDEGSERGGDRRERGERGERSERGDSSRGERRGGGRSPKFDTIPATFPSQVVELGSDAVLKQIQGWTPFGRGSRVVLSGAPASGKTEALQKIAHVVAGTPGIDVAIVLAGSRPEELTAWSSNSIKPVVASDLGSRPSSADGEVKKQIDSAKRAAASGSDVFVLIDSLDAVGDEAAAYALAAARNLEAAGSLTVIATSEALRGGESTAIVFDQGLRGRKNKAGINLRKSFTHKADQLVGASGAAAIDKAVFPGLQGGPHENAIAAIAVALREAGESKFKTYAKQIVKNAQALSLELTRLGWRVVSGGTDNHLLLVDTWGRGVSGKTASEKLEANGIIVNMNTIPFDTRKPTDPSGIRIGTAAETTRGKKEKDMVMLAKKIDTVLRKESRND